MNNLQFPIIKITVFFVIGILFANFMAINLIHVLLLCVLLLGGLILVFYQKTLNKFFDYLFGTMVIMLSFLIGVFTQSLHTDSNLKNSFINQIIDKQPQTITVTIKEKLKKSINNTRYVAAVNTIDNKKSSGNIILNIRNDSITKQQFIVGNRLKLCVPIFKNKPVKNPNQFDYSKYLINKNIYGQVYCNSDKILISRDIEKNIWHYAALFRDKIINNLSKSGFGQDELAVIVALILGQQQDISPEILHDYQFAGAIHILSVSGLHVGFIMLFIGYLLKPLPNNKQWRFYKLIVVITSLWLFGFIAGLAPSVLRSATMFTFVAIGRYLGRGVNKYNTLMASALFILLIEPSFLFDVGFQLSYFSLFFIFWLQPYFSKLWRPKHVFVQFFWDIVTVSVAAQIGAMGLSIYYFHQFPGLFFVTNLIILPTMGFILGYGVFIMILAYFDTVPQYLFVVLEQSIAILNRIIAWIASFESFVIKDLLLNQAMLISLYIMLIMVFIYLKKPRFKKLFFAMLSILIFQSTLYISKYYYQQQKEFIVFNAHKNSLISMRFGQKIVVCNKSRGIDKQYADQLIKQYCGANFIKTIARKQISNLYYFNNKKILVIDSIAIYPDKINPDIIVLSHSPRLNLERFLQNNKPELIIADASNFKSYVSLWANSCQQRHLNFHSTADKGYFAIAGTINER